MWGRQLYSGGSIRGSLLLQRAQGDVSDGQPGEVLVEVLNHPEHSVAAAQFHRAAGDVNPSLRQPADRFLGFGVVFGKRQVFGTVTSQPLDLLTMNLSPTLGKFGVGGLEAALDLPFSALENHEVNVGTA